MKELLPFFTTENIIEGVMASIFIVYTYYVLRNYFKLSKPMSSVLGWFITWIIRKVSVNAYRHYIQINSA